MKLYYPILTPALAGVFLLLLSCKTKPSAYSEKQIRPDVIDSLSRDYEIKPNESGKYLLCLKKKNKQAALNFSIDFLILEKHSGEVIYRDTVRYGEVSWWDENVLLVKRGLGVKGDSNATEIYTLTLPSLQKNIIRDVGNYQKP